MRSYSRCKLTFWKDRWPAFQGLASEVSKAQDWKLVHGLRHHLIGLNELLWRAELPDLGTIECGEPSWTWLNVKGSVRLFELSEAECSIADVVIQNVPDSVVSSLESNQILRVTAFMAKISLDASTTSTTDRQVPIRIHPYPNCDSIQILNGQWYPDSLPTFDGELWALQISVQGGSETTHPYICHGLVVIAIEEKPGFWKRVGCYSISEVNGAKGCTFNREKRIILLI